eukprot:3752131-Pyramimonas_sp.AAC.1
MREQVWLAGVPPRPLSYQEWLDQPLGPRAPPRDWARVMWPGESLCTAWAPFIQRPVDLSCRIYADDASKTHVATTAENAQFTLNAAHRGLTAALRESGHAHNRLSLIHI